MAAKRKFAPSEDQIRRAKAEDIVIVMDKLFHAHIARYVHMSTNDAPVYQLRGELADLLTDVIK